MPMLTELWDRLRAWGVGGGAGGADGGDPDVEGELAAALGVAGGPVEPGVGDGAQPQPGDRADIARIGAPDVEGDSIMAATVAPRYLRGLDVSHHNGIIDWPAVAGAGYSFAFIKATEGQNFTDPAFRRNWTGAGRAGLLRGAYHYFRPSIPVEGQLRHFLDVMGPLGPGDLQPVLDFEESDDVRASKVIERAGIMLDGIRDGAGRDPIIYSYPFFYKYTLGDPTQWANVYPLWVAHYEVKRPALFGGWPFWSFWQYTSTGRAPGVRGRVDLNYFNGKLDQLKRFAGY
jgi:GH25 family lysozyme M1 (1,4-beta-N-acetylmuramidase)